MADRFNMAWMTWRDEHTSLFMELAQIRANEISPISEDLRVNELMVQLDQAGRQPREAQGEIEALQNSKTFRYSRFGRRMYAKVLR